MNIINKRVSYIVAVAILIATTYTLGVYNKLSFIEYLTIIIMDVILIYSELFLINEDKNKLLIILDVTVIVLGLFLSIRDFDFVYYIYYVLALFQLMRNIKLVYFYVISTITNILSLGVIVLTIKDETEMWYKLLIAIIILVVALTITSLISSVINQNRQVEDGKKKILEENLKKTYAYEQLKRAYDELENYTVLKERDRIAREMHDTVGHNLTVTLVELENFSAQKVKLEDKEEFNYSIERVRKSLYDIRTTLHKIKDNSNWLLEIDNFINELKRQNVVSINYTREDPPDINMDVAKCIYMVIQEAITNGIKHGDAKAFIIAIKQDEDNVILRIIDNGKGTIAYKKGFGLNSMEERVKDLKGKIEIESDIDEGFTITGYIPKRGGDND